jgi:uncharacterized protein GlcG (DUF336 family)
MASPTRSLLISSGASPGTIALAAAKATCLMAARKDPSTLSQLLDRSPLCVMMLDTASATVDPSVGPYGVLVVPVTSLRWALND